MKNFNTTIYIKNVIIPPTTQNLIVNLSTNDIFNWLTDCDDPETLIYLGNYALSSAKKINNFNEALEDYVK